jgi:hypothetical protein
MLLSHHAVSRLGKRPTTVGGHPVTMILRLLDWKEFGGDHPHGKIVPTYYIL